VGEQAGLGFGGLLRQLRADARLTQEELAEAARVSLRAVSDLERGINRTARKDTAGLLAGALGLDGQARELFVLAARGRVSVAEVLAAGQVGAGGSAASGMLRPDAALAGRPGEFGQLMSAGTVTFLFTDIEGSTALLRRVGEGVYAQLLAAHYALIRSVLAAHDGRELNTLGDGFFAAFASPRACVAAAVQMQQVLEGHAWPAGVRVRVRMGVHTGEASDTAAGPVGLDVHRAARVAAVAHGGQVLVSETAAALVQNALPPGAALIDLGMHQLKDLGCPEQIFQLDVAGLPAEFPPLRSLGNPALPNNLPAQLATFIGRERELADVRGLVGSSRLVTLTGAGGAGKTRLALQAAAELLDGSGDGVWLVELAAVTGEDAVAPAICQALGVAPQPGRPVLETLLDALALQDVLIVLDNCEHLIGACAKTADAIVRRCPRVHLVTTSREPLGIGGETIYRVPPLSLPVAGDDDSTAAGSSDAVALFVERARQQGVSMPVDEETGPLVVSVCRRLDGMPLAIELAAARLRSLSLAGLHDRLDQRFRLLTRGSRTALPRQQTLRAAVDWSYSLLNRAEQLLLGRLSVFAGSFDLDAAEAACGTGGFAAFDVADLLGSLVDKSLVVAEPAGSALRYRLLETIRQYAAERLADADEAAAVGAAHCGHFLALAEVAVPYLTGPDQGRWFARLATDHANLRRAADYAARDLGGTGQVLRFGVALRHYWIARYLDSEAVGLLLPVLERPEARADPRLFAGALVTAAICARNAGPPAAGRHLGERAVDLARGLGDDRLLIEALSALCACYHSVGQPERGFPLGQEAAERARRLGDDFLLGFSLLLWLLTVGVMEPARAGQLYTEAIAAAERSGDQLRAGVLHNNAAVHALRTGDTAAARAHLDQAAEAMRAIGQESDDVALNQGWLLREENDTEGARPMFETALRISRRNGDRPGLAYASLGLACLAADHGDWPRAATLHAAAQALIDQIAEPWQVLEERYRRDSLHKIRTSFGEEQFARAYAKGMTLSLEQALGLALGTARPA
jgi:predicted ATPase/class 3 adenylate cyclase/DNA-binding XRE family transcriptional regulator